MLICSSSVYSQSTVNFFVNEGNPVLGIGPNESFVLFGSGDGVTAVDTFNVEIFLGQAAPGAALVAAPPVVNISGAGIFGGASSVFTPANVAAGSPAQATLSIPATTTVAIRTPIAEVFFDTTGFSDGDQFIFSANSSTFANGGLVFVTAAADDPAFGTIASAVPEPSSGTLLLALASVAMIRRNRV